MNIRNVFLALCIIIFFITNSKAKDLYLQCEQKINNIRSDGGGIYKKDSIAGYLFVELKKSKINAFNIDGEYGYQFLIGEKVKKNELGFSVSLDWEDKEFKTSEMLKFLKPMDVYAFKRTSYFWAKSENKDTITDYDSSGRCDYINKKEYTNKIKKFK